jgi:hypothetical protein
MKFKEMWGSYIEMSGSADLIRARRKIWPLNVNILLGIVTDGSPAAVVRYDDGGVRSPEYVKFGMSLFMNGEIAVFGWCPSIEDVMGQDWELIRGR